MERKTPEGTRDWRQVSIVMDEMADSWSGFVAYAYDGPDDFVMMSGGPYNGADILTPTKDFYNFKKQLDKVAGKTILVNDTKSDILPRRCSHVETGLLMCCDLRLFNDDMIPSFLNTVKIQAPQKGSGHPAAGKVQEDKQHSEAGANYPILYPVAILVALCWVILKGYRFFEQRKLDIEEDADKPLQNGFDTTNGQNNGFDMIHSHSMNRSKYGSV